MSLLQERHTPELNLQYHIQSVETSFSKMRSKTSPRKAPLTIFSNHLYEVCFYWFIPRVSVYFISKTQSAFKSYHN